MSAKLDELLDPRRLAECRAADAALSATVHQATDQTLRAKLDKAHRRVAELSIEAQALKTGRDELVKALKTLRNSDGFMHLLDGDQQVIEAAIAKATRGAA